MLWRGEEVKGGGFHNAWVAFAEVSVCNTSTKARMGMSSPRFQHGSSFVRYNTSIRCRMFRSVYFVDRFDRLMRATHADRCLCTALTSHPSPLAFRWFLRLVSGAHQLLQRLSSNRMSAAQAAKHEWLNRSPEDHARRSELRARTMEATAAKRALRLDAAVFKAERAADNVEQLEERVQGSSVLGQSPVAVSAAAAEATEDVVSTLRESALRVTLMAAQAHKAQSRVEYLQIQIAAGETGCVPNGMPVGGEGGIRFIGSYAEHKANEYVWKAEMYAGEAEARSTAAAAAVEAWEKRLAEIAEEEAVAVEAAKAVEAIEATLRMR